MPVTIALGALAVAIWAYLLLGRGFFWWVPAEAREPNGISSFRHPRASGGPGILDSRFRGNDDNKMEPESAAPLHYPTVVAVVPARNEAAVVGQAIASLLAQDCRGEFSVVLVDDHSSDGTADIARAAAKGHEERLRIVAARSLPEGWTGKLWALSEGVRQIEAPPDLYLFTDADIAHHPTNLSELVARLEREDRDLVSLMVKLRCQSLAERFLIPSFVFFFALLYPFAWSNDPGKRTAAAAGGCILIRRGAYERIGGYAAIRSQLIDDCALARAVKHGGSIWLGLTPATRSLRSYPHIADIWNMVARTAYTQLDQSPLLLAATVLGLALTYLAPPLLLLLAGGGAAWLGGLSWAAMTLSYVPMLRFYGLSQFWAPLLPAAALVYLAATVASARRHWQGRGGEWKGRVQWQSR